jgi:phage-related minor tail protein
MLRTALTAVFADLDAKLDQLNAQTDDFNPEAQATFDSIKQVVADKQAEVGDVNGSDAPAEPTPADGTQV